VRALNARGIALEVEVCPHVVRPRRAPPFVAPTLGGCACWMLMV
jgi:hypothetical protein